MALIRKVSLTLLGLLGLGLVGIVSFGYWTHSLPPVHELLANRIEPDVVTPDANGDFAITVMTSSVRRGVCPTHIYRFFSNEGGVVVYSIMTAGGLVPTTGKPVEFPYHLKLSTAKFPPGAYAYTAFAINNCANGSVYVVPSATAKFTVLENMPK